MTEEKLSFKHKVLYGLLFAVIGALVKYIFDYFIETKFDVTAFILSFVAFWIIGFILVKKRKKKKIK